MDAKHKLNVEGLAVESFAAGNTQPPQDPKEHVNVRTCVQTACPPYVCCA